MLERLENFIILHAMMAYGKISYKKYINKSKKANEINKKLLLKLIKKNRNTEFGKKYDFGSIKTITDYQKKVPYTTFSDYKDYVEKTVQTGKQNLITADKICYFANTSGTMGNKKRIPIVNKTFNAYLNCATIFIWNLKNEIKKRRKGIIIGKGLNTIETESEVMPGGIRAGFISGYALSSAKMFIPAITCLPKEVLGAGEQVDMKYIKARYALEDRNLIYLMAVFMSTLTDLMKYIEDNHEMLINDIENGNINSSIKIPEDMKRRLERKLKPNKQRAEELRKIFSTISKEPLIPLIWPKMSLIVAISTGEFSPFETKMRKYCGESIPFSYEMYASSEALIATSLYPEDKNYMVLPDSGFYEFLPVDGEEKPLLMHELEVGKLYEIVVTNLAGLYRYRIKDVIRVTGFKGNLPLIQFAYRKEQLINMVGVHLTIESMTSAIKNFEKTIGVNILDYSLYVDTDYVPNRVVLFIETEKDISNIKEINLSDLFDKSLSEVNEEYCRMLRIEEASKSVVYTVKSGTYENYRMMKIKNGVPVNQIKTVRIIDKKEILDYLMKSRESEYVIEGEKV